MYKVANGTFSVLTSMQTHPSSVMETMFTPVASPNLWLALKILRYTYPTLVFFYFFIALGITVCYMQAEKSQVQDQHVRRGLILCCIGSLTGTYAVEIVVAIIKSSLENGNPGQDRVVSGNFSFRGASTCNAMDLVDYALYIGTLRLCLKK
ncbi:hypothetical protein BPOR_0032g00210 [Botrytis porri]|uniref:Uncharacterized protein n=1 Tax=Botrytis porri TaxID=87229 RepID=A0A4Z1L3E4_9HELO|nr:hypothetical protein BPOR_0032g00210 [Botrytis porri]